MSRKKLNLAFLATFVIGALLVTAACSGGSAPAPSDSSKPAAPAATSAPAAPAPAAPAATKAPAAAPAQASGQKSKLVVGVVGWVQQGIKIQELADDYMKAHPDVEVELQPIPEDWAGVSNMPKKIQMEATQQTSSKDVIIGVYGWGEVAPLVALDLLEPLNDLLPKSAIDDCYPNLLNEGKFGDKIYMYPLATDVVGWIYRPSMLKEAGFSKPPATWDEVNQYIDKIKAKYGDKVYPIGFDWKVAHRGYLPILSTLTDKPFVDGVLDTSSPQAKKALEMVAQYYKSMPASSADDLGAAKAFQTGNVAMEMYWPTQVLRGYQAGLPKDDVMYAPLPAGTRSATIAWTGGSMIPKYAKNKKEAIRFITEGLRTAKADKYNMDNWKLVPYKSATEKLKASAPDWYAPVMEQAKEALPIPLNIYYNNIEHPAFNDEIQKLAMGKATLDDTAKTLTTRIQQEIEKTKKR